VKGGPNTGVLYGELQYVPPGLHPFVVFETNGDWCFGTSGHALNTYPSLSIFPKKKTKQGVCPTLAFAISV